MISPQNGEACHLYRKPCKTCRRSRPFRTSFRHANLPWPRSCSGSITMPWRCPMVRWPTRIDLAAGDSIHRHAPGLPGRDLGRCFLDRGDGRCSTVRAAHVCADRFLSPLLFPQGFQDVAGDAVHLRPDRSNVRAARAAVVGSAPSQPSPPCRYRTGHPFTDPPRLHLEPPGLVSDAARLLHRLGIDSGPAPLSRIARARPFRHRGANHAGGWPVLFRTLVAAGAIRVSAPAVRRC